MTIEDIDHLLSNSEIDSATFFIDSNSRDLVANPDPSSFTLTFTEPLKNVCGFEILDATIPVTMWIIDTFNNVFAYSHVFYNIGTTVLDFQYYFKEMNDLPMFSKVFNNHGAANIFLCLDEDNFKQLIDLQTTVINYCEKL